MDSLASIRRVDLVGVCRGYVGVFENCVIGVSPTPRSDSAYRNHIICVKLYFVFCTITMYIAGIIHGYGHVINTVHLCISNLQV